MIPAPESTWKGVNVATAEQFKAWTDEELLEQMGEIARRLPTEQKREYFNLHSVLERRIQGTTQHQPQTR